MPTAKPSMSPANSTADESMGDSKHFKRGGCPQGREVPLIELELRDVTYSPITVSANTKGQSKHTNTRTTVLHHINTTISPYQLTAWMGPSGSGKSSMLSVAADLVHADDLSEQSILTVNGQEGRIPKRLVGVVWQDDLLLSNLTVQENIFYAARLKTCEAVSDNDVREVVQETMAELGLLHVQNSLVGSVAGPVRGVSGGERKRVSVASELVSRPSVLLLDEPTSGLDATTAQSLIATLKDLANLGHSIAVVIHQPRTTIYNMFDHLLLLSHGHVIYDGNPAKARTYLEQCPSVPELPPETGIADWLMDIITHDTDSKKGEGLAATWVNYAHKTSVRRLEVDINNVSKENVNDRRLSTMDELNMIPKFNTTFFTQLKYLTARTLKQQRGERLTATAALLQFAYLFFTAFFWWRVGNTTSSVFSRNSLLFFMIIAQSNGIVTSSVTIFQQERSMVRRERAKKMYGVSPFFLGKVVSDLSNNVLLPLLYGMVVYWTAGLRPDAASYFKFILTFYLTLSTAQSMGLWLGILIPRPRMALALAPPITLFTMILGGFYLPLDEINVGIRWATWLSFARYGYSALVINEYEGRFIECSAEGESISIGSNSGECPMPGEDVMESLGITGVSQNFWFNVGMAVALQVVFRFAAYVTLRRDKK